MTVEVEVGKPAHFEVAFHGDILGENYRLAAEVGGHRRFYLRSAAHYLLLIALEIACDDESHRKSHREYYDGKDYADNKFGFRFHFSLLTPYSLSAEACAAASLSRRLRSRS